MRSRLTLVSAYPHMLKTIMEMETEEDEEIMENETIEAPLDIGEIADAHKMLEGLRQTGFFAEEV